MPTISMFYGIIIQMFWDGIYSAHPFRQRMWERNKLRSYAIQLRLHL